MICRWLQETYDHRGHHVYCGYWQGEEVEPAREKAQAMGVKNIYIEDLTEDFVANYVYPMFRANTVYGRILAGYYIARPLITRRLVEIARENGAYAVSHGSTGKGNDQCVMSWALMLWIQTLSDCPGARDLNSGVDDFCEKHQIPVDYKRGDKSLFNGCGRICTFLTRRFRRPRKGSDGAWR